MKRALIAALIFLLMLIPGINIMTFVIIAKKLENGENE